MQRGLLIAAVVILSCNLAAGQAKYQVLYDFGAGGPADAIYPNAGLIADERGNLYGTAGGGSTGLGVVFQLSPKGGVLKLTRAAGWKAESFIFNDKDGEEPVAGVTLGPGAAYGTTYDGGTQNSGTVFELTTKGETVLHNFCAQPSCEDGKGPGSGGLLLSDRAGNLFGTTETGGAYNNGVVFEITP